MTVCADAPEILAIKEGLVSIGRGYNLDIRKLRTAGGDLGYPGALAEELTSAETEVASVRDELKGGSVAEALLR